MRRARVFTTLAAAAVLSAQAGEAQNPAPSSVALSTPAAVSPVDWVNTYIGTGGGGSDYGGTMPFVTTPFGTTNWTAQTRQNSISVSSYAFEDTTISGFIGTHQPAIWMGDYGYVTLIPEVDAIKTSQQERKLPFSREHEITTPYYYSVELDAGSSRRIRTEITATDHCGFLRFTFPKHSEASVAVEATRAHTPGFVHIDAAAQEIVGYNPDRMDAHLTDVVLPHFKGYFVVKFSAGFRSHGVYLGGDVHRGMGTAQGPNAGGYATFDTSKGQVVEAKVGTSFISIEQARSNLRLEMPSWDFETVRAHLKQTWNQKLRGSAPHLLHGFVPRPALPQAVLRPRPLLQRLR